MEPPSAATITGDRTAARTKQASRRDRLAWDTARSSCSSLSHTPPYAEALPASASTRPTPAGSSASCWIRAGSTSANGRSPNQTSGWLWRARLAKEAAPRVQLPPTASVRKVPSTGCSAPASHSENQEHSCWARGRAGRGLKDAKEIWQRKQRCPVAPRTTRQSGIGCSGGTAQCTRASHECQTDAPAQMFQSPTCGSRLLGAAPASERGTEQSQNGGLFADDRTGAQRSQAGSKPWALRDRGRFVNRRREAQSGALERRPGRRLVQTSPFAWGRDRSAQRAVLADGRVGACAYAF